MCGVLSQGRVLFTERQIPGLDAKQLSGFGGKFSWRLAPQRISKGY